MLMSKYGSLLVLAYGLIGLVSAIPIDNGVEGDPEIECGSDSITVNFNTRNDFGGHVFVKGRFSEPGCKSDEGGRRVAGIKLGFDQCGTQRSRSLNPKGVFVTTTVVISFHPQFLTKVDRAYQVQCFYMEADKTVSQDLEVSEITTALETVRQTVPMPVCQYDILDGGPDGQAVKFASIGQQVYHKWTCVTETTDMFCAVVHSCFVDDGAGNHQQLLDENGCTLDKFLLQNLEYSSDLMAGREAHVFKYADKPALFFQCQVTISIKEPGEQCARPQCGEANGPLRPTPNNGPVAPGGSPPPRGSSPRPAGSSPRPGSSPPPRGSSPRPASAAINGPLNGQGRFVAPLQSLLASQSVSATSRIPRGSSPLPFARGSSPSPLSPFARGGTQSPFILGFIPPIPSRPPPPPPAAGSAAPVTPAAVAPAAIAPAAVAPAAGSPPPPPPPRPAAVSTPRPAIELGPEQLNVPVNLGPAPAEGGFDFPDRRRRAKRAPAALDTETIAGTWDLRAQPITALDIDDDILDDSLNRRLSSKRGGNSLEHSLALKNHHSEQSEFCMSPVAFGLFLAFVIAFSISSITIGVFQCLRRSSK